MNDDSKGHKLFVRIVLVLIVFAIFGYNVQLSSKLDAISDQLDELVIAQEGRQSRTLYAHQR